MKPDIMNRRKAIASLGLFGGSALLSGCGGQASGEPGPSVPLPQFPAASPVARPSAATAVGLPPEWKYVQLDPYAVAEVAYKMYADGGCMYAIFGSIMRVLAEKVGEPFNSFPINMMRYGNGGMGGMGSVCGVVNGCAALIGLFEDQKEKDRREELISDICTWYERTPLPIYEPAEPAWADDVTPSVSDSILCHVAVAKWCQVTGCDVKCAERRERCRRASVDGVIRVVDLLNRNAADPGVECLSLASETTNCLQCHGPRELNNATGRMNCASCHSFEGQHPAP
jgi:hypothetical protein